jgi:hypothetical protein
MIKKLSGLLILLFSCLVLIISAYSQEDMQVVSNEPFDNPRRPPSVFRHDEHNELAGIESCSDCHHVYDESGQLIEDESSEDQPCSECHELERSGNKPGLMKAFHLNCKGCHKAQNKGPLMCGQCHVKRRAADE